MEFLTLEDISLTLTQSFALCKDASCSVQLCLAGEIFRQLLTDVDAEQQRRFTECAIDENAVGSIDTKATFVECQNPLNVFLPFHLHGYTLPSEKI